MKQPKLASPTRQQIESRENIKRLSLQLIALLDRHNSQMPIRVISELRDINNQISYELNDLNTYD